MISHVWTVICSRSVIDEASKNISLMDIVEQVTISAESAKQKETLLPMPFEVVTLWAKEAATGKSETEARLRLLSPEGKRNPSPNLSRRSSRTSPNAHSNPCSRPTICGRGDVQFCVDLRRQDGETWREVAHIPLQIQIDAP